MIGKKYMSTTNVYQQLFNGHYFTFDSKSLYTKTFGNKIFINNNDKWIKNYLKSNSDTDKIVIKTTHITVR